VISGEGSASGEWSTGEGDRQLMNSINSLPDMEAVFRVMITCLYYVIFAIDRPECPGNMIFKDQSGVDCSLVTLYPSFPETVWMWRGSFNHQTIISALTVEATSAAAKSHE
jgi:hypothetical protein